MRRGCDVSERITEAELRDWETDESPFMRKFGGPERRLVAEVRRLRGLIAFGATAPGGEQPAEFLAEAGAIRKEQGEKLCTCVPSHEGFDGTCRNCREGQGRG